MAVVTSLKPLTTTDRLCTEPKEQPAATRSRQQFVLLLLRCRRMLSHQAYQIWSFSCARAAKDGRRVRRRSRSARGGLATTGGHSFFHLP